MAASPPPSKVARVISAHEAAAGHPLCQDSKVGRLSMRLLTNVNVLLTLHPCKAARLSFERSTQCLRPQGPLRHNGPRSTKSGRLLGHFLVSSDGACELTESGDRERGLR